MALLDLINEHIISPNGTEVFIDCSVMPSIETTSPELLNLVLDATLLTRQYAATGWLARLRIWFARLALRVTTDIDYSLKRGDEVVAKYRVDGEPERYGRVVDVNWAMLAIAVSFTMSRSVEAEGSVAYAMNRSVVVWPAWSVKKTR